MAGSLPLPQAAIHPNIPRLVVVRNTCYAIPMRNTRLLRISKCMQPPIMGYSRQCFQSC